MASVVVNGDTSGAVTLSAPAVAGTVTVTLPAASGTMLTTASTGVVTQAMLSTNVTGNGPAFLAYASALTIASGVATKIPFSNEQFDTNNNYDPTTNYRFTPTVAGYYWFKAQFFASVASGRAGILLYKNGVDINGSLVPGSATGGGVVYTGVAIVSMNGSSDYVEAYAYQESGGSTSINTSSNLTNFCGYIVRSA
jgi:hypothetical protein